MTRTGSIKGIRVLGAETTLTAVGNTTETGTLELHELSTNGQHKVSISAPNSLSADYSLTLPGDDGDADQVLTTDGSGILTWEDQSGGGDGDITSVVAGDGLTGGATSGDATLNVNVDDSTIETNSDTLRIKDSGVTLAKMSNLANMKVIGNTSGGSSTPLAVSILDEDNMSSNSATAVASQQSIKAYVDSVAQGLNLKEACRVATTGAGTLSSSFENGDTIDGVTLSTNDRILIKDQSTASENGIYVVKSSGAPDRSGDMPASDTASGDFTFITEGTINGDNGFVCTSNGGSDTVGTHNLSFTQFSGAGQITSGDGLTKSGNTLSIDAKSNSGIVIHSTELSFDLGASSITGTLAVGDGGTGATSFSDKAVIITQYSGTDTLAAAVMDANGELLIGGTSGPAVSTLTSGSNITITNSDGGISIASTDTNTQLTDEQVQDLVGAMFSSNTETGITSTYQDGDGTIDLVVGTLNQNTTGNAATATALATARTIGGVSFDGSANINLPGVNATGNQDTSGLAGKATILANARTIGGVSFDGSANINLPGVNATGNQDTSGLAGKATILANARTIGGVSFDGSANINLPGVNTAGNQNTSGNADTATLATNITSTANNSTGETVYLTFVDGATGSQGIETDTGLNYNPSTGVLVTTSVTGNLTGEVTGNAATATALATARTIGGVSFDGSANINLPGVNATGNQDTSGLAGKATILANARTIGGVSFDGSANINLPGVNATGNQDTSGLAGKATILANTRTIGGVSFDGSGNIDLPGVNATGNQDTSGLAGKATILANARTIGGVSFDGSANINLPGVNAKGNQDTSGLAGKATILANTRTIGGVSFDGSANINLPGVNSTGNQDTSGLAGKATILANTRTIGGVSFDGSANINLPGVNTAGNQNTSGLAGKATILATARTIGGVSFDGSANINLPGVNTAGNQNTTGLAGKATLLATARTIGGVSFDGSANINLPGVVSHSRVVYKTLSLLSINTTFLEIENGLRIEMELTSEIVTFELTLMRLRPNSKLISFDLQNYNASGSPSLLPAIISPVYDIYAQEPVTIKFTLSDLTIGDTLYVTPMIKASGAYAYLYRSSIYGYMSFTATEFGTAGDVDEIGLLYND